jgi:BASS family bile acid:Na+ symporter
VIKLGSAICLFTLCYSNAAVCLPILVNQPDWDFLGLSLALVTGLCVLAFSSGSIIGHLAQTGRPQRIALMFGLGMSNNGTGLVLASMALGSSPIVMLPMILHNLIQHLAAGCVSFLSARSSSEAGSSPELNRVFETRPEAMRPYLRKGRSR